MRRFKRSWEKLRSGLLLPRLWLPMSPGYPCCCGEKPEETCFYEQDDFDRADSDDLGSKWTEEAGSWSISSNVLTTSSSNGLCICDTPGGLPHVVQVWVRFDAYGDTARIVFDYTDSTSYSYVEIHSNDQSVSIFNGAGVRLQRLFAVINTNTWYQVRVCIHDDVTIVNFGAGPAVVGANMTNAQTTIGLGTGGMNTRTSFDDFSFQRHLELRAGCPNCSGLCDGHCIDGLTSERMQVEIVGMANGGAETDPNCPSFDGTWVLFQQRNPCSYRSADLEFVIDSDCSIYARVALRFDPVRAALCGDNPAHNHSVSVWCGYGTSMDCVVGGCASSFRHTQVNPYDCDGLVRLSLPPHASGTYCDPSGATCHATAL